MSGNERNTVEELFQNANQGVQLLAHVRLKGQTHEIPMNQLNDISTGSSDDQIKTAIATYLGLPESTFQGMIVVRNADGSLVLRPEAVFGA